MNLSIVQTGDCPLIRATVNPFVKENLSVRASMVRVNQGDGSRRILTNARLRMNHLIALDSTSTRKFQAATKDHNGVWSEWTDQLSGSYSNFSDGASVGSIGSLVGNDFDIEEPGIMFPSLEIGTSRMDVWKTLISEGFTDEERRQMAPDSRAVFSVVLKNVEEEGGNSTTVDVASIMHRWFKALNGPWKPFYFDFKDPSREDDVIRYEKRYAVRFRDPEFAESLFDATKSTFSFTLVEVMDFHQGGAV